MTGTLDTTETPDIRITPSEDADALSAVARATFLETFAHMIPAADILARGNTEDSAEAFRAHFAKGSEAWIARIARTDAPIGFALLTAPDLPEIDTRDGDVELKRIYLLHRFHGGGTGRKLYEAVEQEARSRGAPRLLLGVYHDNPAVAWYKRQGFETVGERSFRVGDSLFHDLIMAKAISG